MSRSRRGLSRVRCDLGVCVEACEGVRRVAQLGTHRGARYGELEDWLGAQLHLLCERRAWKGLKRNGAKLLGRELGDGVGRRRAAARENIKSKGRKTSSGGGEGRGGG